MNQYESAMAGVGQILEPYDYDRMFPTFGFGGVPRFLGINATSHCFAMNGTPAAPEIAGVANILNIYRQRLNERSLGLSGPTFFGEILSAFKQYTEGILATGATQY